MSKMGPAYGSDEYKQQIETIYAQFVSTAFPIEMLGRFLLLFIFDETYSRPAICEAEKKIRNYMKEQE